jgi:sugar lactone lactonase YvrE
MSVDTGGRGRRRRPVGQALPGLERIASDPGAPAANPGTTNTLPRVDPHVRAAVTVGGALTAEVAAGPSGVWVLNGSRTGAATLVRVDPATDEVVARIDAGLGASRLQVGEDGSVWLHRAGRTLDRPELVRVDPATNRVADVIALPEGADHLAFAEGLVWATEGQLLHHIDPDSATVTMTYRDPDLLEALPATGLAGGTGRLWLVGVDTAGEQLFQLDPVTGGKRETVQLSSRTRGQAGAVAAGERVVAVRGGQRLYLVDGAGVLRATVPVPEAGGLAVGSGAVWVADPARGRLLRVDPGF